MKAAGLTDPGRERRRNEDCYLVRTGKEISIFAVADGMGGHVAGDVASRMAISVVGKIWDQISCSVPAGGYRKIVEEIFFEANNLIWNDASLDPARQGMGTTLTMGLLHGANLVVGHVGDSRAYLITGGRIERLTCDHSLVEQLVQAGDIDPVEAQGHPQRHILTRALGSGPGVEVDLVERKLAGGEALLLCTDGLTSLVREEEMLDLAKGNLADPQQAVHKLVELANARGGSDNITVVLAANIGRRVA